MRCVNDELEGCKRKWSWIVMRHYPSIALEGPRKTTKPLEQQSRPTIRVRSVNTCHSPSRSQGQLNCGQQRGSSHFIATLFPAYKDRVSEKVLLHFVYVLHLYFNCFSGVLHALA